MTAARPIGRVVLLAAGVGLAFGPAALPAQEATPLVKSEVVRLLVSDTYGPEERQQIVRRSCLTFSPTEGDLEDFRRLGASQELLEIIRDCAAGEAAEGAPAGVEVPPPPGEVAVSAPAVLVPADTGGVSPLSPPPLETGLEEHAPRRPPPPADRDNLLARVEVPPRLRNAADVQRTLYRAAPDAAFRREGGARSVLWVFVDAAGQVREVRLEASSGIEAFDRVALEVARSMQFSPGTSGTRPVGMWVQQTLSIRR